MSPDCRFRLPQRTSQISAPIRSTLWALAIPLVLATTPAHAATLQDAASDLGDADLSALMDIKVTSAAKRTERLATSAAAVTVITAEELARLPVTRLEDVFRTVPGMTVSRVSGNRYAKRKLAVIRRLLDWVGVEPERIHFTWLSASEGARYAVEVGEFVDKVRALGRHNPMARQGVAS